MTDETTTRTRRRVRVRDGDDDSGGSSRRRRRNVAGGGGQPTDSAAAPAPDDAATNDTTSARRRVRKRSVETTTRRKAAATDYGSPTDTRDRVGAIDAVDGKGAGATADAASATEAGDVADDRGARDASGASSVTDRGEAADGKGANGATATGATGATGDASDAGEQPSATSTSDPHKKPGSSSRSRSRRSGRGSRKRKSSAGGGDTADDQSAAGDGRGDKTPADEPSSRDTAGEAARGEADVDVDADAANSSDTGAADDTDASDDEAAESARRTAGRQRGRKGKRRTSNGSPRGGVSEETRRSVTEGPPRRMLVSVGAQRTEVAVLEERDLVEHYVTRKENESYVGNIYLGRVQNVLPGMEAAFVDIGKGRNGVLYAGEVNYDDEDVESKAPRIEEALKPGQTVVVQVTKDPMGSKGARLTQQLSLAGRFCVLAIEDGTVGISRKLTDAERDRLRETLRELKPDGFGLIVRTAAAAATDEQLEADLKRLLSRWEQVQARLADAKPLTELYREPELAMRVIRDVYGPEFTELICDDEDLTEQITEYLGDVSPALAATVQRYSGDDPLFSAYEITNQVRRALEKKVWLASGGYLIIEKTEAMWVIDVNTGKFVGESNLEETVLRNNLEAADEIARQLRLRDMGGIIVIDFVDMVLPVNRDEVLKRFKRELARDKTKSRVMEISKLGLVQMTRKNVSQGLTETFTKTCDCCEGRGAQIVDKALKR